MIFGIFLTIGGFIVLLVGSEKVAPEESHLLEAELPQPPMDEMVNQSVNIAMESKLTSESRIEELASPVSEPSIEEVVPSVSEPSIEEVMPPAPEPIQERIVIQAPELKCPSCGGPTLKYGEICEDCKRKREKEIILSQFICKKCGHPQLAIQKIKSNNLSQVIVNAKCPKCGKSTQFTLDSLKIGDWIELFTPSFFTCGKCGSACTIVKTTAKGNTMQVSLYCEIDWTEIQKEIPVSLFQVVMTQNQKV